jgi:hypothetical protein
LKKWWDGLKCSIERGLFLSLCAGLVCSNGFGTTVLVVYTPTSVFIASDSKFAGGKGNITWSGCKIHLAEDYVWASAGLASEVDTVTHSRTFDIDKLVPQTLGDHSPSTASLDLLEARLKVSFQSVVSHMSADFDLNRASVSLIIADRKNIGTLYEMFITTKTFERKKFPGEAMSSYGFIAAGEQGWVNKILPKIFKDMGIVPALNYLITEQEASTPEYVAGPIAIAQIDSSGVNWIQKAACDDKASPKLGPVN